MTYFRVSCRHYYLECLSCSEAVVLKRIAFPGAGSNNVHPDEVELNGTLNALTASGLESLRHRFEEVRHGFQMLSNTSQSCQKQNEVSSNRNAK